MRSSVSETPIATRQQKTLGKISSFVFPRLLDMLDFRICHYDRSVDPARPEYNEHVIFSFWHEYISVILPRWGQTPLTILCSQHRDGEWVNQTALALGLRIVRGSTSRGGSPFPTLIVWGLGIGSPFRGLRRASESFLDRRFTSLAKHRGNSLKRLELVCRS